MAFLALYPCILLESDLNLLNCWSYFFNLTGPRTVIDFLKIACTGSLLKFLFQTLRHLVLSIWQGPQDRHTGANSRRAGQHH